jgi:hypothetical protein
MLLAISASTAAADWPEATVGAKAVWDAATDKAAQRRFIPMQLVVPGVWNGAPQLDLPRADGLDAEGTVWSGPAQWRNPLTGQVVRAYNRHRSNSREGAVEQKMALRTDGAAIGRVSDSRNGAFICDQEAKFPLGIWRQGEVRSFEYMCLANRGGKIVERPRAARITIEELDYEYNGVPHSLRFAWRYTDRQSGEVLDHRTYIFSPGRGLASQARR